MAELKDYKCSYGNDDTSTQAIIKQAGLRIPEVYTNADDMTVLAKIIKQESNSDFCYLPFCHTVEASALGADINFGNEFTGPRVRTYVCGNVDEFRDLPEIDFSKGRINQVLEACRILSAEGENVALEMCGPITVFSALADIGQIIKGWRKMPEFMIDVFNNYRGQLIRYMREAFQAGVKLLCYADPAGGLNILGPRLTETVALEFTAPFLSEGIKIAGNKALIHLCPKTSYIITGLELAKWHDVGLSGPMSYEKACLEVCNEVDMVGEICIQNAMTTLLNSGKIRSLTGLSAGK